MDALSTLLEVTNYKSAEYHVIFEEIVTTKEEQRERSLAPIRREFENRFDHLDLPELPQPLAKSTPLETSYSAGAWPVQDFRPFMEACREGDLETIKDWITHRRSVLGYQGVRDGLGFAAEGHHIDVCRYLFEVGNASVHSRVIAMAVKHRSLPLFELCYEYGYHPNQQLARTSPIDGVALNHCLDNEPIVRFLLSKGADPNLAPFVRFSGVSCHWRGANDRSAPPMNRTSGLALDTAIYHGYLAVAQLLLEHGANAAYSRPLSMLIDFLSKMRIRDPEAYDDDRSWRSLFPLLLFHGVDINFGCPLEKAISCGLWDMVELLSQHGADPMRKAPWSTWDPRPRLQRDAFAIAARETGLGNSRTEQDQQYLEYISRLDPTPIVPDETPCSPSVAQNALVLLLEKMHREKAGAETNLRVKRNHMEIVSML